MSESPAASETADSRERKKITFRFCAECSNLLYPKEDEENQALMFACRTCQYSEPAQSSCIFRNDLSNTIGETAGITSDVASDPTVGPPVPFPGFCTLCGMEIFCIICGEPTEHGLYLEADDEDVPMDTSGDGGDGGGTAYAPQEPQQPSGAEKEGQHALRT